MPRYFFYIRDGADMPDDTGTELPDDNAARTEAVVLSGGLLKDLGGDFWTGSDWHMQVVRDDGEDICELKFSANTAGAVP